MPKFTVVAEYPTGVQGEVTLPEGKTWANVKGWYVKYATVFVDLDDGTQIEQALDGTFDTDWKRPIWSAVRNVREDGETDWDGEPVAENGEV